MPDDDVERFVAKSRAQQGLPRYVEDDSVAARIVGLLGVSERADAPGRNRRVDNVTPYAEGRPRRAQG